MNNLKQAMTDILRIVLVVALPVILIFILLLMYRFMWPSSSLNTELPSSQQSKMINSFDNIQKQELTGANYAKPDFISDI